jgi:hypothetical protein
VRVKSAVADGNALVTVPALYDGKRR